MSVSQGYNVVMIVPTGVGATIGGYAGDALPSAKLLSKVADRLITHPNVMNGAMLYWPIDNILYVEGYSLDEFAKGNLGLKPISKRGNSIGLLLDKSIEPDLLTRHLQVADAARATLGIDIKHAVVTPRKLGIKIEVSSTSGASYGSIDDTSAIIEATEQLLKKGCNAIAIVARFPEDEEIDNDNISNEFTVNKSNLNDKIVDNNSNEIIKDFEISNDKFSFSSTLDRSGQQYNTLKIGDNFSLKLSSPSNRYNFEVQTNDNYSDSNKREENNNNTVDDTIKEVVDSIKSSSSSSKELFNDYRKGQGVDAIAGVEALLSHIISKRFKIPCAHAPAFLPMEADNEVSPKAAAEELGYTFLPCVLSYLHRAPALVPIKTLN
eukprot:gene6612-9079_t